MKFRPRSAALGLAMAAWLAAGASAQSVLIEGGLLPQLESPPADAPAPVQEQAAPEAGLAAPLDEAAGAAGSDALADRALRLATLAAPKAVETLKTLGVASRPKSGPRKSGLYGALRAAFDQGAALREPVNEGDEAAAPSGPFPGPVRRLKSRGFRLGSAAAVCLLPFAAAHAADTLSPASKTWANGSDIFVSAVVTIAAAVVAAGALRAARALAAGAMRLLAPRAAPPAAAPKSRRLMGLAAAAVLGLKASAWLCPADPGLDRPRAVAATPFEQKHIMVDGVRLRYVDEGHGPVLLLIPGLTSRIEEFDEMTPSLKTKYRVISLDLPGSGYSDKPDRDYTLGFYEDTVLHFLDALRVKEAYLGGGSLGGNLVLRLARRAPDRFPKIVSWAPASSWPPKPPVSGLAHGFGGYALFWPSVGIQSGYWFSPEFPRRDAMLKEQFAYYNEVMSPGFLRMYWDLVSEQMGTTLQDIAPEIRQPVLLLWGDQDDGGGMGDGVKRLNELIPNSRLIVLPGARHSLAAERPKALARAIAAFLRP